MIWKNAFIQDLPVIHVESNRLGTLYFTARKVGHKCEYVQQTERVSTCNATLLWDKSKKNVAHITRALCSRVEGTFKCVNFFYKLVGILQLEIFSKEKG